MEADEIPLYPVAELARYLQLAPSTVDYWWRRGGRTQHAVHGLLSFEELISLLFVRELRARGVRFKDIFAAETDLQRRIGQQHPFAWQPLWVEGRDVLVPIAGSDSYLSPNRGGQATLPSVARPERVAVVGTADDHVEAATGGGAPLTDLIQPVLAQVEYTAERAIAWHPAPHIVARPAVQFGLPCVEGSRLPTRTVLRSITAGDSPEEVARAYGISLQSVQAVVGWEQSLAA